MIDLDGTILGRLPGPIPTDTIRVEETHELEHTSDSATPKTVYEVEKAPFESLVSVSAIIGGVQQELAIGDDVEVRDVNDDGEPDSVAFIGDELPDPETEFTIVYDCDPVIARYVAAFDDDIDDFDETLDGVVDSKYIDHSSGMTLDLLGARYGPLGERRGLDDDTYRAYLKQINDRIDGTGTVDDIHFITEVILDIDPDGISISEDFDRNGFIVKVTEYDQQMDLTSFDEMIERASPLGVDMLRPLSILGETVLVGSTMNSTVHDSEDGLSSGELSSGDELSGGTL